MEPNKNHKQTYLAPTSKFLCEKRLKWPTLRFPPRRFKFSAGNVIQGTTQENDRYAKRTGFVFIRNNKILYFNPSNNKEPRPNSKFQSHLDDILTPAYKTVL